MRTLGLLFVALSTAACFGEPSPLIRTRVVFPPTMKGPPGALHFLASIDGRAEAEIWPGGVPLAAASAAEDGYDVVWDAGIGTEKRVALRVWFDANADGVENEGDAVGTMAPSPFIARDAGGCSTRRPQVSPAVTLQPLTH
jgi:hypothetical protein